MSIAPEKTRVEFEDPLSNFEPKEYADLVAETLGEDPVTSIRSRPYAEISAGATILQALRALAGLRISSLAVVDDESKLVGVFTERDVLDKVAHRFQEIRDQPVRSVMTSNPVVVHDHYKVGAALAAIATSGYRHVPVLDADDRVAGMVSPRRVFSFLKSHCG